MSVKVKLDGMKSAMRAMNSPATQSKIGKLIVEEMRKSLAKGISPVRGIRRFEKYRNPKRYPGKLKPKVPVNLKLTGDMLNALESWVESGKLIIGFRDPKEKKKAAGHNDGIDPLPKRHFLPTEKGEVFTVTITREMRNLYARLLSDIIRSRR